MVLKIKEMFDTIVNWRSLINVNALALIKVNILLSSVGRESWVTVILLLQVCFDKLLELTSPLIYQLNIAETNVHSIARSTRATYIPNWSLLWFKHKCMVLLSNNCILIYFALFFQILYIFDSRPHSQWTQKHTVERTCLFMHVDLWRICSLASKNKTSLLTLWRMQRASVTQGSHVKLVEWEHTQTWAKLQHWQLTSSSFHLFYLYQSLYDNGNVYILYGQ